MRISVYTWGTEQKTTLKRQFKASLFLITAELQVPFHESMSLESVLFDLRVNPKLIERE